MRPLTVPTDAELGLLVAASYETDLRTQAGLLRRFNSVRALIVVATAVFGYDFLSVFLFR